MSEFSLLSLPTSEDSQWVDIDALIVGRPLQHPIHNERGVLLLAEGQLITSDFKQKLRHCNISRIRMHRKDADRVTLQGLLGESDRNHLPFDSVLMNRLDEMISSGNLLVSNTGPAVKRSMVLHGCRAYNPERRLEIINRHRETAEMLDQYMQSALKGERINGTAIAFRAASFLGDLTGDVDCTLSVASTDVTDENFSHHCLNMSLLGMAIAIEMGLDAENVRQLGLIALVQDWGMLKVPKSIREKPGRLTPDEYVEIQKHTIYSLDILEKISGIPTLAALVAYQMHESPNGGGYPRGKQKTSIHQFAKILRVADTYIALTSPRPFRPALMPYAAMECLLKLAQREVVDMKVTRALLVGLSLFPIGSWVTLSDGSVGQVLRRNGEHYNQPIVQLQQNSQGETETTVVDLKASNLRIVQALPTPGREEIALTDDILKHYFP